MSSCLTSPLTAPSGLFVGALILSRNISQLFVASCALQTVCIKGLQGQEFRITELNYPSRPDNPAHTGSESNPVNTPHLTSLCAACVVSSVSYCLIV